MKKLGYFLLITMLCLFAAWGVESHLRIMGHSNLEHPLNAYNVIIKLGTTKTVKGRVTESNVEKYGCIEVTDVNGETWVVEVTDTDEISIGTKCKIKFNNQNTRNPYDDEVIDIKF